MPFLPWGVDAPLLLTTPGERPTEGGERTELELPVRAMLFRRPRVSPWGLMATGELPRTPWEVKGAGHGEMCVC